MQTFVNSLWMSFSGLWYLFVALDIILVFVVVFAFFKSLEVRPKFHIIGGLKKKHVMTLWEATIREQWHNIIKKFRIGSPDTMRIAIIEADMLTDNALKQMGLEGEHMADRLSQLAPEEFETLPRIWRAHRLRNDLVHTPNFGLTPDIAAAAMDDFEAFFKDIGIL